MQSTNLLDDRQAEVEMEDAYRRPNVSVSKGIEDVERGGPYADTSLPHLGRI